jgi:hypothetical protein
MTRMTQRQLHERQRDLDACGSRRGIENAIASVWGLRATVLAKRRELVDLRLAVAEAEERLRELRELRGRLPAF